MCDFCIQHGQGKKWYLEAENYSQDLLSDVRRRDFIADFFSHREHLDGAARDLTRLSSAPRFVRRALSAARTRRMKKQHFGQVLPMEDVEQIFGFVNSVSRLPCICRETLLGREVGYCYGVSLGPGGQPFGDIFDGLDDSFFSGPDTSRLQEISKEEAIAAFAEHEKEGLCHTVWTFMTPFIGGVCNCDRSDCMAMKATVVHDVKVMFRAEYIAEVNRDLCTGCRSCMRLCQFGALAYSAADQKAVVDHTACYGCGICRSACPHDAMSLRPRAEVPVAASLW
jgi:ferredoxin